MKVSFPNIGGVILLVIYTDYFHFFQRSLVFPSFRYQDWLASRCVTPCFGTVGYSRMKVPFVNIAGVVLMF